MQQMWYVTAVVVFISVVWYGVVWCSVCSECNQYLFASVGTDRFCSLCFSSNPLYIFPILFGCAVVVGGVGVALAAERLLQGLLNCFSRLLFLCRQLCFHFWGVFWFWISLNALNTINDFTFSIAFCYVVFYSLCKFFAFRFLYRDFYSINTKSRKERKKKVEKIGTFFFVRPCRCFVWKRICSLVSCILLLSFRRFFPFQCSIVSSVGDTKTWWKCNEKKYDRYSFI